MIEHRFRAMGSDIELLVLPPAALDPARAAAWARGAWAGAEQQLEDLEARWSRFRPDSELSRLNRDGQARGLRSDTFDVIVAAVDAWRRTDALFDPTVLDALLDAGYDESIERVAARSPAPAASSAGAPAAPPDRLDVPGPVGIELEAESRSVRLPDGVHLDLGGIGKGTAADRVAAQLLELGAVGACVNLGGDVRVAGRPPDGGWFVGIDDPLAPAGDQQDLTIVRLTSGALATSSRTRRAWMHAGRAAHHLIDPATGRPADRGVASVTVLAATAQHAEVLAKAAFVAGVDEGAALVREAGADGLIVTDGGALVRTPGFAAHEVAI